MIWNISGKGLPEVTVEADSFDEALEKARETEPAYSTGKPKKEVAE